MPKLKTISPLIKLFSLKNKNIIIIGGTGKMGISFSKILSEAGARVFLLDINLNKKLIKNPKIIFTKCDVTNESQTKIIIDKIIKKYKKINVMIYNVYSKPKNYYKKFENYDFNTWKKVLDTNLSGAFTVSQIMIKHFKKKKIPGNLIFVLSTYGIVGPDLGIYKGLNAKKNIYGGNFSLTTPAAYTSSKSALLGLMKYIASTNGKDNIRANSLTPGGVFDGQEKRFVKNYNKKVPLKRMANFDDYDGAILFLSSDASSYMTGSNLIVDGGWTAW